MSAVLFFKNVSMTLIFVRNGSEDEGVEPESGPHSPVAAIWGLLEGGIDTVWEQSPRSVDSLLMTCRRGKLSIPTIKRGGHAVLARCPQESGKCEERITLNCITSQWPWIMASGACSPESPRIRGSHP